MNSKMVNNRNPFEPATILVKNYAQNKSENITQAFDEHQSPLHIDLSLTKIEITILIILFCLTIIGNLAVIVIVLINRKRRNSFMNLRNVSRMSFYILNLSIADIFVALMSVLPQLLWRSNILFLVQSKLLCKLVAFAQVIEYVMSYIFEISTAVPNNFLCENYCSIQNLRTIILKTTYT